uniref:uncharacterized protein LOC100181198 isoform X2 n=1 Tax=Ciona intestinalis TaxID=7719 RepID=UPI0002B8D580|nr:uncharacterized protein LOC100181198 isoform X2 [Ciona intestinalis]|eukprot:XP_002125105.2 uncharacterized protein LOC100181198 isoform X2 [Ciona intestinalis]
MTSQLVLFLALASYAAGALIYEDNFDYFDSSKWFIEVVSNPHNNELQYYTDRTDNIRVEDGHLVISPLKENYGGKQYTSGRIHSNFAWKYGRVEVRAKSPNGYGLWPAIWMMPRDSVYGGWPESGEIDIMEARGQDLHQFGSTIHYGICCDNHYWESSGDMQLQCSIDQYHVYTLDWTPTELVYRLDGKAYYSQSLDRVISWMYDAPGQPFDQYFYMILNVAVGGDYLDNPKPSTVWNYPDAEMWVDYVRVYPLEDIASQKCMVKDGADPAAVCGNIDWACGSQNWADVSAQCTSELLACCDPPYACDGPKLNSLASEVYTAYDNIVNDGNSCNFGGTAQRLVTLNDGDVSDEIGGCLIKDSADDSSICGAMEWACYSQNYADVSSECSAGSDVLNCCSVSPSVCNDARLHSAAEAVFQSYYNQLQTPSACDFGGVCYLENSLEPLACTDGYDK